METSKETPKQLPLLTEEQISRLIEVASPDLRPIVGCVAYAGLRRSELIRLRWEDIHWETQELCVVSRKGQATKNYQSRKIPLHPELEALLRSHQRRLGSPYVFVNKKGLPFTDIRCSLNSAALRAGVPDGVGLHQLRHAFCSHAMMKGIDARTVQQWMGHKSLRTTERYAHTSPSHHKEAIQKLVYDDDGHYTVTKAS